MASASQMTTDRLREQLRKLLFDADSPVANSDDVLLRKFWELYDFYEFSPVGFLTLDRDAFIQAANLRAAALFGLPRAEFLGQTLYPFVLREDRDILYGHLRALFKIERPLSCELRACTNRHQVHWFRLESIHDQDWKGRPASRTSVLVIDDRKQAEEALRESEIALRLANESLEQQVRERTAQLTGLVASLQLEVAQRKEAEDKLSARAKQLRALAGELTMAEQRERKRLSSILHDGLQQYLATAKMRLEGIAEQLDRTDVKQAAQEIHSMLGDAIRMSRSLSADLSPPILHEGDLSAGLEWVARRMRDVHSFRVDLSIKKKPELPEDVKILVFESVRELLFNAVKHSKGSRARVSMMQTEGGELRITVDDNGAGFNPGRLNPIGDESGGYGLFSIRERIGLIGGSLEIDSAPGKGSRFTLTVPFGRAAAVPTSASLMSAPAYAPDTETLKYQGATVRVLVADDHTLFRDGIARLLTKEPDLTVVGQANDGQEAIELARELVPDVILMDVSMPGVNGIEATRVILREHPHIRIIGLSMYEDEERAEVMRAAGAVGYKNKGCGAAELVAAIRAYSQEQPSIEEKIDGDEK